MRFRIHREQRRGKGRRGEVRAKVGRWVGYTLATVKGVVNERVQGVVARARWPTRTVAFLHVLGDDRILPFVGGVAHGCVIPRRTDGNQEVAGL